MLANYDDCSVVKMWGFYCYNWWPVGVAAIDDCAGANIAVGDLRYRCA